MRPIDDIGETALMTAAFRAWESRRPDAHFNDAHAAALAGARGQEIATGVPASSHAWAVVVRTCLIDDLIMTSIRNGTEVVLNLACGLDTRPYRLPVPKSLHWIEADLPSVIYYKQGKLRDASPVCRLERIPTDIRNPEALARLLTHVGELKKKTLVITEGLLLYLPETNAVSLSKRLLGVDEWITDLLSPSVLAGIQAEWNRGAAEEACPIQFAPREGAPFFERHGWRVNDFRSYLKEAPRLRREAPNAGRWRFARFFTTPGRRRALRLGGVAHFRRPQ